MEGNRTRERCLLGVLMAFSLFLLKPVLTASKLDYYNLYDYLFRDPSQVYRKEIRPAINESHTIVVNVGFYLHSIIDIDEKEQTVVTSGSLALGWEDSFLAWYSVTYGDIRDLLVPQSVIYLPDVIVANSVRAAAQLGYPQQQVRLSESGSIYWEPNVLLTTACDIDITYFPFDTQICHIYFETAVSRNMEILLTMAEGRYAFNVAGFSANGQWELIATDAEELNFEGSKASVRFGMQLKRRRIFYVLNIVLPVFFLSLTSSLVFALPAEEGERMGTGITILLSFAVYLTIVSDLVPNTSLQVSVLAVYLTSLLGMCAISVVVCTFSLRLHFRDEDIPVGPKTTKLTQFVQAITCTKKDGGVPANKVMPVHRELTQDNLETKNKSYTPSTMMSDNNNSMGPMFPYTDPITWKDVAKTLDKFCFILFTFLSFATTLVCLLILVVGGKINAPTLANPIEVA